MVTSPVSDVVSACTLSATVPVVVIVPPLKPVPATIDVTVPVVTHEGMPVAFSVSVFVPAVLPGNVTHVVLFQYMISPGLVVDGKTAAVAHDGTPAEFSERN